MLKMGLVRNSRYFSPNAATDTGGCEADGQVDAIVAVPRTGISGRSTAGFGFFKYRYFLNFCRSFDGDLTVDS